MPHATGVGPSFFYSPNISSNTEPVPGTALGAGFSPRCCGAGLLEREKNDKRAGHAQKVLWRWVLPEGERVRWSRKAPGDVSHPGIRGRMPRGRKQLRGARGASGAGAREQAEGPSGGRKGGGGGWMAQKEPLTFILIAGVGGEPLEGSEQGSGMV